MALGRDIVDTIIREHAFRPISGEILLIGRQALNLAGDEVLELMRDHGVAPAASAGAEQAAVGGAMSAAALFALLGIPKVSVLDTAAGADIVHDMAMPLPDDLKGCADFIVDGGALGDLFAPALALRNYAALLRPGGRLIAINNLSGHFDPYSIQSAAWYLDYFVVNDYADCKVYVLVYLPDRPMNAFCVNIDCLLDPDKEVRNFLSAHEMAVLIFAEKGAESSSDRTPVHAHRRSAAQWAAYRRSLECIALSKRPHLVRSRGEFEGIDVRGGHLFMRADYTAVDPSGERPQRVRYSAQHERSKLKILCVGTGRDGTQSLNHMVEHVFSGSARCTMHEYCCREFYQAFCDFKETGDAIYEDALRRMVADCSYDCIVGNGYAAILPLFAEHYGRGLKIIHLRRADRDACIASLIKNCEMFPTAYRYYSDSADAVIKRMAAFHFGEMSRADWDRLPIAEKLGWYYDKTHALVREHLHLFDDALEVTTESLADEATRRAIADFVGGGGALPPKMHLNASVIDIGSYPKEHRQKMHWLMGRLDIERLAADEVYALDYFLDKFVAWTGYRIAGAPDARDRTVTAKSIEADLERAAKVIGEKLRDVEELQRLLREHGDKGPER